jgi:hypothetical protein
VATVDVSLSSEDAPVRRERHTLKNVKGRWLFAAAAAS